MDKSEVNKVPPYNTIKNLIPGVFAFTDSSDTFLYPHVISNLDLYTLNNFKYFYSPSSERNLIKEGVFKDIVSRSDYIISTKLLNEKGVSLISEVGTADIFSEFKSYSILDKKYNYLDLQAKNGWNELMYVYGVETSDLNKPYFKRLDNHPTRLIISNVDDYKVDNEIKTSVRYSRWWRDLNVNKVILSEDEFGFMVISEVGERDKVDLFYLNPYIYAGLFLSLLSSIVVFYLWRGSAETTVPSRT